MKLQEFIKKFEDIVMVDPGTITLETNLNDLDDWDSLSMAALLATLEEEFGVNLENHDLKELDKFSEIINLIKEYIEM